MPSSQAELKSPREAALWLARQALAMQQEVAYLLVVELLRRSLDARKIVF